MSPLVTLLLIPIIGAIGMATEASSWFLLQRSMQNAADSAALAAATNACDASIAACVTAGSPYYDVEAKSVAAKFGFLHNVADTTVVAANGVTCPSGETNCYSVLITRKTPIYLVRILGFSGDSVTASGAPARIVNAIAVARPKGPPRGFCLIGLQTGNVQSIRINGGPFVDLAGCDLWSNGDLVCNGSGSDTGVENGYAAGTSSCGANQVGGAGTLSDPYSALSAEPPIPTNTCGALNATNYPQGSSARTLDATESFATAVKKCGDTRLTTDVTVTTPNSVLTVYNGHLDLNGHTLSTSGSGSLTIIFSGISVNGGATTYHHILMNSTGTGTVDIAAPTTGLLKGVAIMQDGRLVGNRNALDMTYNGNDPTLKIQGLIYMPNGEITMKGAINLHTGGLRCLGIVAKKILVSGTGAVFDNTTSECVQAGLILPPVPDSGLRQALVR
ncbi:MAG TPA: pilus assembly protein TadG-related protein [Phenylobacterium sp.]|nr:pilus assembly protein TadG-related protein [Phenylobacterium sp.]